MAWLAVPAALPAVVVLPALTASAQLPISETQDHTSTAAGVYVAMGDSFTAGSGAGHYIDRACRRSANAYPAKWAAAHSRTAFRFVACGGVRIAQVRQRQLPALGASTTLTSIGIGANDSELTLAMLRCRSASAGDCWGAVSKSIRFARSQLSGQLDLLFADIRKRAPKAKVVVVGYPYLYKSGGTCPVMDAPKRTMVRRGNDVLTGVMAGAARRARFVFLDTRPVFAGHEACTAQPWINVATHHPNAAGHIKGFYPAFSAAVRRAGIRAEPAPKSPAPGPISVPLRWPRGW